jgi:predicted nucleic acid-binding protein
MSRVVIDASMTLSWLLPDESSAVSLTVRDDVFQAESVWVPAHWRLEVCNSLWTAERRKRLNATGIAQAVALFTQLPVIVDPETNDRAGGETLALARQHTLSVYDAAYLELALRRGASLASLDRPLRKVAAELSVAVVPEKLLDEQSMPSSRSALRKAPSGRSGG